MFILKIPGAFKSDNTKQIYPQNDFLTLNIIRIGEECPYKYAKYIYIAPRKTALPKERMLSSTVWIKGRNYIENLTNKMYTK